jgi:hypothetical protein
MIKRFFSPLPFIVFLLILGGLGYFISQTMPNSYVIANSNLELLNVENSHRIPSTIIDDKKIIELTNKTNEVFKKDKLHLSPVFAYLESTPETADLYPSKIEMKVSKDNKELSLNISYTPSFYNKNVSKNINEALKLFLTEHFANTLNAQKSAAEILLTEKKKSLSTTKKEESHEIAEPDKIEVKTPVIINKLPADISDNIIKFKEFKSQKEAKLKEIQELLNSYPTPSSTPLVMLTSNLQKNYEMQLIMLNGKKDWLKNSDAEQLKKIEEDKLAVFEKLKNENMKLRDDSYFFKAQQDKALREKHTHLLHEEKNNKEVLDALNDLQNGLFEQDQNSEKPINKIKETAKPKNESEEKDLNQLKSAQKEIDALIASISEIDASLELLKSNGISSPDPISIVLVPVRYYMNPKIAMNLMVVAFVLLLLTGLILGSSNKVSNPKTIAAIFDAPLLGSIPDLPNEGLENAKHKKLTDAIDQITDTLTKSMQSKDVKTLNVLSPNNLDGRTQLTGMLSLSFNLKKNMKVIALDTCFNNPKLSEFLELKSKMQSNEEGLIGYFKHLVETKEISETDNNQWLAKLVKPCIRNGVFVISPGNGTFSDSTTFNSRVIMTMYEGLAKYVDLIIADTPPLNSNLSFVSKVLAENSSGNILLIKKETYTKKDLESFKKKLGGANIMGFILK